MLLDWISKALVAASIPPDTLVEVIPRRFALWHVRNDAMMLGLWGDLPLGARWMIAALSALLALLVLVQIIDRGHRLDARHRPWAWAFVGLALGGMAGNLGERAVHWWVTDFLSFRWGEFWLPPGNVADLALFLSFPLVIPVVVFELRSRARRGTLTPAEGEMHLEPQGEHAREV